MKNEIIKYLKKTMVILKNILKTGVTVFILGCLLYYFFTTSMEYASSLDQETTYYTNLVIMIVLIYLVLSFCIVLLCEKFLKSPYKNIVSYGLIITLLICSVVAGKVTYDNYKYQNKLNICIAHKYAGTEFVGFLDGEYVVDPEATYISAGDCLYEYYGDSFVNEYKTGLSV